MSALEWIVLAGFVVVCLCIHMLGNYLLHISKQLERIGTNVEELKSEVSIWRINAEYGSKS